MWAAHTCSYPFVHFSCSNFFFQVGKKSKSLLRLFLIDTQSSVLLTHAVSLAKSIVDNQYYQALLEGILQTSCYYGFHQAASSGSICSTEIWVVNTDLVQVTATQSSDRKYPELCLLSRYVNRMNKFCLLQNVCRQAFCNS